MMSWTCFTGRARSGNLPETFWIWLRLIPLDLFFLEMACGSELLQKTYAGKIPKAMTMRFPAYQFIVSSKASAIREAIKKGVFLCNFLIFADWRGRSRFLWLTRWFPTEQLPVRATSTNGSIFLEPWLRAIALFPRGFGRLSRLISFGLRFQ